MEHNGVLPTTHIAYRKELGTCDSLLCVPYTETGIGEWAWARIVQIDLSGAFDRVNHQEIFSKPCSVGI